jgi:hypothetical protein
MVRLTLRILLLLSVLAAGRIVVSGFIQSDERNAVSESFGSRSSGRDTAGRR